MGDEVEARAECVRDHLQRPDRPDRQLTHPKFGYSSKRPKSRYREARLRGRTSSADYSKGHHEANDREYSARLESHFGSELRLAR